MSKIKSNLIELHIIKTENKKLKFLLLKRSPKEIYPDIWQMVSGTISKSESATKTALREMNEETNLVPEKLFVVPKVNTIYLPEKDKIILVPVFLALVKNNSKVIISDEHTSFKWFSYKQTLKFLSWPGQREAVKIIYKYWNNRKETLKLVEIKL